MAKKTKPAKAKNPKKAAPKPKTHPKPAVKLKVKAAPKPAPKPAAKVKALPAPKAAPPAKAKVEPKGKAPVPEKAAAPVKGKAPEGGKPAASRPAGRKSSRRPSLLRRGPDGEILAPGDLLLPGGPQRIEEILYLFRGCSAAEHPIGDEAIAEVQAKRTVPEAPGDREELAKILAWARERFEHGTIEPAVPPRPNLRRSFQGVVERAKQRRREIGAFLRGLDLGHTETSHMDAHGEASLTSLMKLAAGLENLAEAEEPAQTDANELLRVFEQLEAATETLIIDVEQTLRRLRDRLRS
ncbi:MAG TPA: hypothetical protein VE359_08945 [Vicinamibacteria bacterium]|nr:hypothetical protein [Vicinamibacteria bacterium]